MVRFKLVRGFGLTVHAPHLRKDFVQSVGVLTGVVDQAAERLPTVGKGIFPSHLFEELDLGRFELDRDGGGVLHLLLPHSQYRSGWIRRGNGGNGEGARDSAAAYI